MQEDLFVEEVDWQDALHGVAVDVDLLTYLEVAEGHTWKALGQRPVQRTGRCR